MKDRKSVNGNKGMGVKPLALLLALALLLGGVMGGTLAWLTDKSATVVNTFTVGDINIELKEHDLTTDEEGNYVLDENKEVISNEDYLFVPGDTLPKDPFVRVKAGSEDCYVFIKVQEINNSRMDLNGKIINWAVSDGWTEYAANPASVGTTYYYCTVEKSESDAQILNILKDNQVTVNELVTKTMTEGINNAKPTLKFSAAAVQSAHIVAEAGKTAVDVAFEQIQWN